MEMGKRVVALLVIVAAIAEVTNGDPAKVCGIPVSGLISCWPAVTKPNPPPPSELCCLCLKQADLECFCPYVHSPLLPSLGIDPELALQIPEKCSLPKPSCVD
ncbi:hypothetical protein Ancab_019967 [Ancistrocladus abbreviatus]